MRKIFLDSLPKWENTTNKGKTNWIKSIGYDVEFIYDNIEGKINIIDYNVKKKQLCIKYNNCTTLIYISAFIKCKIGQFIESYKYYDYKYNIGDIIETKTGNIQILELSKIRLMKAYKYECLIDGNIDYIDEYSLNRGGGCNVCCGRKTLKGINDLWTTCPKIAKLLKFKNKGYEISRGSHEKEIFICPDCAYEKEYNIDKITSRGFSCPKCGDSFSYPQKFGFNILEQLGINFIPEYSPDWIKPKRYDFYFQLDNKEYIVEMDGKLGHGNINYLSKQTAEESKEIDNYKDKTAREYGIEVIRINCFQSNLNYIKNNILNSDLNTIFNLSLVNWNKCHEFACSNLIKIACNYWNNGINIAQISNIMKLHKITIGRYLKQGTELNWCNYNLEIQKRKNILKVVESNKIKVIQLDRNNNFIKEWNSLTDAKNNLHISGTTQISSCCKNKHRHNSAGGYKWMYKEDYDKFINNKLIL